MADELGNVEMQRHHAPAGIVYTAARVEIIKPSTELSVEHEVRMVKDEGMMRLKKETFRDFVPLKLGPWIYLSNE